MTTLDALDKTASSPLDNIIGPNTILAKPENIPVECVLPITKEELPAITTKEEMRNYLIDRCKFRFEESKDELILDLSDTQYKQLFVTESQVQNAKESFAAIKSFIQGQIVTDGFANDNERKASTGLLEKTYGDLYKAVYDEKTNKMRGNLLSSVVASLQFLGRMLRKNPQYAPDGEKLENFSTRLITLYYASGKSYEEMTTQEKKQVVQGFDTVARLSLKMLGKTAEKEAERVEKELKKAA